MNSDIKQILQGVQSGSISVDDALLKIKAVTSAHHPQPLSYSFVLEKDGQSEYVALSTTSSYPIRLDGEF